MTEKTLSGHVYETAQKTIVLVPFTKETWETVKAQLEKDGYVIRGVHVFADKRLAYRVHIDRILELESQIAMLQVKVDENKTLLATLVKT